VFYHDCLDLSVNCKYLISMWLCLYTCWSNDSPYVVKLILYHVNFVTVNRARTQPVLVPELIDGNMDDN
jgi:hypothetical protein